MYSCIPNARNNIKKIKFLNNQLDHNRSTVLYHCRKTRNMVKHKRLIPHPTLPPSDLIYSHPPYFSFEPCMYNPSINPLHPSINPYTNPSTRQTAHSSIHPSIHPSIHVDAWMGG